ncbi:MAG: acetylglutamate kinase, partial [Acidimicrobiia bacterium]
SSMSDGKEIRTYLSRFSQLDQARFAVIKIGGAILQSRLEETAAALALLHTVGLTPIVLHGGGPQLDERLTSDGIVTDRVDGLRVTTSEVLDAARDIFTAQNISLVEAVRGQGVSAHGLTQGAFDADIIDQDKYGFVGEPADLHLDLLRSIVKSGAIPILTCLGVARGGQLVNMNADSATRLLVHVIQPMKIIFLVDTGGLRDGDGRIIESINLAADFDDLMSQDWVHSGMRLKLAEIRRLLDDSPPSTSVSITSPATLVKELFTHGGAGTLVRKGEEIIKYEDKADLDRDRIENLVQEAFGRKLEPRWWDRLDLSAAYISERYRAGAVVTHIDDFTYLDKFAIHESAQGEGLARTVWTHVTRDFPVLFWRSRSDNRFNAFYAKEADGTVKRDHWSIYWIGETDFDTIGRAVKRLTGLPAAFRKDSSGV